MELVGVAFLVTSEHVGVLALLIPHSDQYKVSLTDSEVLSQSAERRVAATVQTPLVEITQNSYPILTSKKDRITYLLVIILS